MIRDFTEENKQKLLDLVNEVEEEKWCDETDWIGDRWLDLEGWIGALDVQDYITEVDKYHKKVIDKNNTTVKDIDNIFTNVNSINTQYVSCFAALLTQLRSYTQQIANLAITIDPANGVFNSEFIGNGLKRNLSEYLEKKAILEAINSNEGLTEEKLTQLSIDNRSAQDILEMYGNIILEFIPNVSVGEEIQVPIGPNMVFYYKVDGDIKGKGNIDLNYVLDEQKLMLKKYSYKTEKIFGIDASADNEGNVTINASGSNYGTSVAINSDGLPEGGVKYEVRVNENTTYTMSITANPFEAEAKESVLTEIDGVSITSTIGIKKSTDNNWSRMPEPVPITSPYESVIPEFDINWEAVGDIVIVAGITYVVVKTITGIALAPYTGGLSLGLLVV